MFLELVKYLTIQYNYPIIIIYFIEHVVVFSYVFLKYFYNDLRIIFPCDGVEYFAAVGGGGNFYILRTIFLGCMGIFACVVKCL